MFLRKTLSLTVLRCLFLAISLFFVYELDAQQARQITSTKVNFLAGRFIENIGQYDHLLPHNKNMGKVLYGFEGFGNPVLFTSKGLVYVQEKVTRISRKKEKALERKGHHEEDIERRNHITQCRISLEWQQANAIPEIVTEGEQAGYHTYGMLPEKARAFKQLIYRNLYPDIDLVFYFPGGSARGFEYNFIVRPGGDVNAIAMKYGGDVKAMGIDGWGQLFVASAADTIYETVPVSYSVPAAGDGNYVKSSGTTVNSRFNVQKRIVSFITGEYDREKTLVVDPFVSVASGFSGLNGQIAKDIDFDYQGNVYVSGGGEYNEHQISKYSPAGNLLWTFSGLLANPLPQWNFGKEYGGWAVEKSTGRVYAGQGYNNDEGTRIIRLNAAGVYDNYISDGDINLKESWKLVWNCANGNPQILICGGSTSSNSNFSVLSPPSTTITPANITGVAGATTQDIADAVVDPLTNSMYSIFADRGNQSGIDNYIFKHNVPYSAATIAWNVPSGYMVLDEARNRPYLHSITSSTNDNSINALAVNSSWFFYWDGTNLKAFDKLTGAQAGTPVNTGLDPKFQGGIYADECNNVFTGYNNGLIKVYRFNGTSFDDAAVPDITIPGFGNKSVYDLAYNEGERLLYACGNGFVAAFDVAAYCPGTVYTLTVAPDCPTLSATATLLPTPPAGTLVTYSLYIGATLVTSNNTGVFTGLTAGQSYSVRAFINEQCSGTQTNSANFSFAPCFEISATTANAVCSMPNGSITVTVNYGTPPHQFSLNGINFQSSNVFTGLLPGNYTVTAKDFSGVIKTTNVVVGNTVPVITVTNTVTPATCAAANGSIAASVSGGTAPHQFSLNGVNFQPSNLFTGLAAGNYIVTTRDVNNCISTTPVTVNAVPVPVVSNLVTMATCNLNNGTITVSVTGGNLPFTYSINGINFQTANSFTSLAPGNYTITVKDAANCTATAPASVGATPVLQATMSTTAATCNNNDGSITINASGGALPYSFIINSGTPQAANVFNNLPAGSYNVVVRDAANCRFDGTVQVGLLNNITASAGADKEICRDKGILLTATATNASSFSWLPATGLNNATLLQPTASPLVTTQYELTATKGPCIVKDTVTVLVNPRPIANAGPDSVICYGKTIQLHGSGGTGFQWSPATFLSSTTVAEPFINNPTQTIIYRLHVTDINGCSSAMADSVRITVLPPPQLFAGNDTTIVAGQPLQLFARDVNNAGFNQYTWLPASGLSNAFIQNPVAMPDNSIVYRVTASTPEGCTGNDEINVRVFKKADIYVASAFTPNKDGLNDIIFAVPVGIRTFRFFRIYNRWGELVFSTSDYKIGWNGVHRGKEQGAGTFVWQAEATDYQGRLMRRKGLVTLVR